MVKIYPVVGALFSLSALILLSIGASTNRWVSVHQTDKSLNPTIINSKLGQRETPKLGVTLGTAQISYTVWQFGLWVSCYKEHKGAVSCSYVGGGFTKCSSNVCWIRITSVSRTTTCKDDPVYPIKKCGLFQFVRIVIVLGLVLLLFGCCAQVVSLITVKRSLAMLAGIVVFISALLIVVGFAVFYTEIWIKSGLANISTRGYSLFLVIISFPLALVGGVISCFAASMGLRHKEVSDYSASNY